MSELARLLGQPPPPSVAALPEGEQDHLAGLLASSIEQQRRELAESFAATMRHVPFPLRAVVKRLLF